MYVSELKISGVRGFSGAREVDLDFTRPDPDRPYAGWTVLAGRNGSGKSTLLQAIALCLAGPRNGMRIDDVDSDGLWVSGAGGQRRPLRQMSDGYRAVTALVLDIVRQLAAAYPSIAIEYRNGVPTLPYPGVVLIDEVDAHLHVSWQKKIGEWLKAHFPAIQFIVTSHSPYICQSADPGGLIRLPGPEEPDGPRVVGQDLYERVVYGSGDDAILTELFGVDTPYSAEAERLRAKLGDLEIKVLDGTATPAEAEEHRRLTAMLTSSPATRADEIAKLLRRDG